MIAAKTSAKRKEKDRVDIGLALFLVFSIIAITIGLFIDPTMLFRCIASVWVVYVLGLIFMESDTARAVRGHLYLVTFVACAVGGLGYLAVGAITGNDSMVSSGVRYFAVATGFMVLAILKDR